MTEDQRKKYEEAAIDWYAEHPEATPGDAFVAGCEFASQDTDALLKAADILAREFSKCKDGKLLVEIERDRLQAENKELRASMDVILMAWRRGDSIELYEDILIKHNLLKS